MNNLIQRLREGSGADRKRERIVRFFDDLLRRNDEYYAAWYATAVAAQEKQDGR